MPPVTLITGAGSGIGREIALVLSGCRHALALVGRTESSLKETAGMLHPGHAGCAIVVADISRPEEATGVIDRVVRDLGTIDNLVNNAGAAPLMPIEQHTPRVLEDVYRINAIAPANLIARVWPVFKRQRTGCIVNISTIGTLDPFPGFFGYAAAKAALNTMTLSCAKEGAAFGVRAFSVAPGAVETEMLREVYRRSGVPHQKGMPPIRVAQVVQDCIEHRRDAENGKTIVVES
jgi:NAD(P)-dependent dehydrogenase (short-subunit alcohol dehydrogenase family)